MTIQLFFPSQCHPGPADCYNEVGLCLSDRTDLLLLNLSCAAARKGLDMIGNDYIIMSACHIFH